MWLCCAAAVVEVAFGDISSIAVSEAVGVSAGFGQPATQTFPLASHGGPQSVHIIPKGKLDDGGGGDPPPGFQGGREVARCDL